MVYEVYGGAYTVSSGIYSLALEPLLIPERDTYVTANLDWKIGYHGYRRRVEWFKEINWGGDCIFCNYYWVAKKKNGKTLAKILTNWLKQTIIKLVIIYITSNSNIVMITNQRLVSVLILIGRQRLRIINLRWCGILAGWITDRRTDTCTDTQTHAKRWISPLTTSLFSALLRVPTLSSKY